MSVENGRDGFLPEDLLRCRRLVAVMRGTVLAPSRKQQVMKELVIVVSRRQERQHTKWWANDVIPSPRARYLRDIQIDRIKTIQKRWRRHMLQKRIAAKLRLEQKWRSRQGISCFRKSALLIQRIFRGHFVRKNKVDMASYLAGLVSRLERLRGEREAYHMKCEHIQQELQQVRFDIETIREIMGQEEKAAALFMDKSVAGGGNSAARADVIESVEYYKGEVVELEELTHLLEKELHELSEQESVVHHAATLIQALCRGVRCRMEHIRERQRQQQVLTRMLQSKDLCYDRMHLAWIIRNQKLWDASARTIARLYHVQHAKSEQLSIQRDGAARRISCLYRDVQARTDAKQSLQWRQVKHRAREIATRKLHALMQLTWSAWFHFARKESQRRKFIAEREMAGTARWRDAKAKWFLSTYRKRVAKRQYLEREIMHELDIRVLNHIRTAVQTSDTDFSAQSAQEISAIFLLLIRNDVWAWQVPNKQLYFLARRYVLPLDPLPVKQIHQWLNEEAPNFVDLYAPLPTQTLLVLEILSQYFTLHSRILMQIQRVRELYEGHMLMREYLALLYTANVVRLSPSTTFSSQQRQRAVQILREKDRVEYLPIATDSELNSRAQVVNHLAELVHRDAFTSFHCLWNDHLCERCLAMKLGELEISRRCKRCGRHQYEDNTLARDLRLESRGASFEKGHTLVADQTSIPVRKMWVSTTERCDFMILNAFLHVFTPVNHENRRTQSLHDLWRLAMSSAYEPMTELYDRLPTGSLNDLLNASREELLTWAKVYCPQGVDAQLDLFITCLKSEWVQLDARLAYEAQAVVIVIPKQQSRLFRKGEPLLTIDKTPTTKSLMQRKKNKLNGRLQPLLSLDSATQ